MIFPKKSLFSDISSLIKSFHETQKSVPNVSNKFWFLDWKDIYCFSSFLISTILVWIFTSIYGSFSSVSKYWDGPNYVYAAITMYDIPQKNPWTQYFHYDPSYFACHLPGFPLVIRLFAFFTIGNYYIANLLAILFCSFLLSYSFRRLLIIYDCVENPTRTTIFLSVFPMRLLIYHSVGASEPLFLSCVCFSFIFYKTGEFVPMILSVWYGCFTRIEGNAIGFAIGVCYILKFDIIRALKMFITFIPLITLLIFHKAMFNDAFAYLTFNSKKQGLLQFPPFQEIVGKVRNTNPLYFHSFTSLFFPLLVSTLLMIPVCGPVAVFAMIFLAYVSLLRHIDLYRYSLPCGVFSLLIGFDSLFSSPQFLKSLPIVAPLYIIICLVYSAGQINSNVCWDQFLKEVYEAAIDKMH